MEALDPEFSSADNTGFIPMNLCTYEITLRQADVRNAFALAPPSASTSLAEADNFPNPGARRRCLDVGQIADDLEMRDPCSQSRDGGSNREV
jgi:hypothetical protein